MDPIYEAYTEDKLNEARYIDKAYAKKSIDAFNKKYDGSTKSKEIKELAKSVIKDLGYKPTKDNINSLAEHFEIVLSIKGHLQTSNSDFADIYKTLK